MKTMIVVWAAWISVTGQAAAETWNTISRNATKVFLADVDSIATEGEVTSIKIAAVPRTAASGDHSHTIEMFQFQCAGSRWRTAGVVEYGPNGVQAETYPEADAAWEDLREGTLPQFLKGVACDGERAVPPVWPTLVAFIDAGRP